MRTFLPTSFVAGHVGQWRVDRIDAVIGDGLSLAARLAVIDDPALSAEIAPAWTLRGTTSNARYTERSERDELDAVQAALGRPLARRAALIPIRKNDAWWALAQDERRAIFEQKSHHIGIGLDYLPAVARRLYHSRELGEDFDFLTWFEYSADDSESFEFLVRRLRNTEEWVFVDREVDIRLVRDS